MQLQIPAKQLVLNIESMHLGLDVEAGGELQSLDEADERLGEDTADVGAEDDSHGHGRLRLNHPLFRLELHIQLFIAIQCVCIGLPFERGREVPQVPEHYLIGIVLANVIQFSSEQGVEVHVEAVEGDDYVLDLDHHGQRD